MSDDIIFEMRGIEKRFGATRALRGVHLTVRSGEVHFGLFTVVAVVVLAAFIYLMVRPNKYANNNEVKLDTSRI